MKASELIVELQKAVNMGKDLDVKFYDYSEQTLNDISQVEIVEYKSKKHIELT